MNTRNAIAPALAAAALLAAGQSHAGAYIGADGNNPTIVTHPSNYSAGGGPVTVGVCISPSSAVTTQLVVPVQNVIRTMNGQQPTLGNLLFGNANNIPSSAFDAESVLLHEAGHCIGLAHPNLATESGLPASQRDYTKSSLGNDSSYDLNDGADNVQGSADDLRGDDVNLHWFRTANNDPFTIAPTVDSSTYSRSLGLLPSGSFAANGARDVANLLGLPPTEAVMQQGQFNDEAQRTLGHDDVATLAYARAGLDEVAGTADDSTTTLVYQGITNSNCDITVIVDNNTGFASCAVGLAFVGGGDHFRITTGTVRLNSSTNWFYNQVSNEPAPNEDPVLAPIGNLSVLENQTLVVPLSATDANANDTLAFTQIGLPGFCTLTDNGNRTGEIACTPGPTDSGDYTVTVFVNDNGTPFGTDSETFVLEVVDDNTVAVLGCRTPSLAIVDNATVDDTLTIPDAGTIADLDVTLIASHTYVGDLSISVQNVGTGTSVEVLQRPGVPDSTFGCSSDDIQAVFDDEGSGGAAEDTCSGTPPAIGGTVTPFESLAAFDGEQIAGDWRLSVTDAIDPDAGTVAEWCISARIVPDPDVDSDGDGVLDSVDNCTAVANADQRDTDGDGYGNLCDGDLNDDCVTNAIDLGLLRTVFFTADPDADFNGDGIVNAIDLGTFKLLFFSPPGPSGVTSACDPG